MSAITAWFKSLAGGFADSTNFQTSSVAAQTFPSADELVASVFEETAIFTKPAADGMASTATAATAGNDVNGIGGAYTNTHSHDMEVFGFSISPNATLTADNTNFATLNILTDDAAGGAAASALALATTIAAPGSGNWATNVAQKVTQVTVQAASAKGTSTPANFRLRPGARLYVSITKSGAGVVVPICTIHVQLRKR